MSKLSEDIENIIRAEVNNSKEGHRFREPIVGFASADDPMYEELAEIIGTKQLLPTEILPKAKTVIVYFIPFAIEIIEKIQGQNVIVQEWSDNYTAANDLLARISSVLEKN